MMDSAFERQGTRKPEKRIEDSNLSAKQGVRDVEYITKRLGEPGRTVDSFLFEDIGATVARINDESFTPNAEQAGVIWGKLQDSTRNVPEQIQREKGDVGSRYEKTWAGLRPAVGDAFRKLESIANGRVE